MKLVLKHVPSIEDEELHSVGHLFCKWAVGNEFLKTNFGVNKVPDAEAHKMTDATCIQTKAKPSYMT